MSRPDTPHRFLVIDDNADSRTLLCKTLHRKYPDCLIQQCQTGDTAIEAARTDRLHAIVAHRTFEYDGETLIRLLRRVNPNVPLIMVSGYDRREVARAAGADAFMNYDAWLTIGNVVAEALAARAHTREQPGARDVDKDALGEPELV